MQTKTSEHYSHLFAHCVLNRVIMCEGVGNKTECVATSIKGGRQRNSGNPARRRPGSARVSRVLSVRRAPVMRCAGRLADPCRYSMGKCK